MISAQERETLGRRIEGPFACRPGGHSNGGVTDFLDDTTSCPLAYDHHHLESSHFPYSAGGVWAEPPIDHAVERMSEVVEGGDEVAEGATAGRRRGEEMYSVDAAGRRFAAELEKTWGSIYVHPSR